MKKILFLLCGLTWGLTSVAQTFSDVERKLFDMEGVQFKKIETPKGFEAAYQLMIRQPLDHTQPDKGTFYQKVFYSYRKADAPTVIITEGYERGSNRIYELTDLLNANQIQVEHRYFGDSKPDSMMYQYLTLENVAADLHHINQLFHAIHKDDFISTGISKGGQTTIFYRYFYPNDVEVSVPYVAPLNTALEDKRIYTFLDTVGTKECRDKILSIQKYLLKNREESLMKLKWFTKGQENKFTYLNLEKAFEYAVLEYSFSFWQWGSKCEDIPSLDAGHDIILEHFLEVSNPSFFADGDIDKYSSHYYQAGTQMGYYGYDISDFKGLIKALDPNKNPSAIFMPKGTSLSFNSDLTKKVSDWITSNGDQFVYIYGGSDTWSATGVRPNNNRDALWYYLKGKDHAKARIKNLSETERKTLLEKIGEWLKKK